MTTVQLLAPEALDALRAGRPAVPRPGKVRYPWWRWAAEPFLIELAVEGSDFWCDPKAFAAALSVYAARNDLVVQRAGFRLVGDDGSSARAAFLFRFSDPEGTD